VRRGVAEIQPRFPDQPDIAVTLDSQVWKEILTSLRNPIVAYVSGDVQVQGNVIELVNFLRLFQSE
jgi:putative sterol carrier protein